MESKFYEEDKLLIFKITDEIDDCSVQKIRRKADYEMERYMPKKVIFDFTRFGAKCLSIARNPIIIETTI